VAYRLYRHFNEAGELLYVGISMSAFCKLTAHEITAGWFPEIRAITITPYRTRAEAAAAEIEAIKNEKPRYNQQHHR
jgi:excinuclease UvrABC nuclease subunit